MLTPPLRVERALQDDGQGLLHLLAACGLPLDGLLAYLATAIVARMGDQLVGCAALEVYPDGALLRSVAVHESVRGRGVGQALTESALNLAREAGVRHVYLLTTTAEGFFPRFGFGRVDREEVPPGIRGSVEFTSACPSSASVMRATL